MKNFLFLLLLFPFASLAHDSHDPVMSEWTMKQQNINGLRCCNETDVYILEQDEWKLENGVYWVFIENKWYDLKKYWLVNLIHGPNPSGKAVLWYSKTDDGDIQFYCFTPGVML
jgi:hypothetical protein